MERAQKLTTSLDLTNIQFERGLGSEINYQAEFGQVWLIDSLHWMSEWRECLRRSCRSLVDNGSLFLCYSIFSPRIRIPQAEVVTELVRAGMDLQDLTFQDSQAHSPRAFISAKKQAPEMGRLVIPSFIV